MDVMRTLSMRMFGHPRGLLGRIGGAVMARMNWPAAAWGVELLQLRDNEQVLEVGCGPGVAIELLASAAPGVRVAGVDPSRLMVRLATERNAAVIARQAAGVQARPAQRRQVPPRPSGSPCRHPRRSLRCRVPDGSGCRALDRDVADGVGGGAGRAGSPVMTPPVAEFHARPGLVDLAGGHCGRHERHLSAILAAHRTDRDKLVHGCTR